MKLIDISMPIHDRMMSWGDIDAARPVLIPNSRMPQDRHNESAIRMSLHNGTHVDAPFHMVVDGKTIDEIPIDAYYKPCRVIDLTHVKGAIQKEDLEGVSYPDGGFLLLKTANSFGEPWSPEFVFIAESAAIALAASNISGVGIDALGVERSQPGHPTHLALFGAGKRVLEGLRLAHVVPGDYQLIAFPLYIKGGDGSPVRAVLMSEEG